MKNTMIHYKTIIRNLSSDPSPHAAKGFALPTVLVASVVMLMVIATGISTTVAVRTSLDQQKYDQLASLAAEAGTAYAQACLQMNSNSITWSDAKPLRPNTDCNGDVVSNLSAYVLERNEYRTYFVVNAPSSGSGGFIVSTGSQGYIDVLRKSTGLAWQVFTSRDVAAQSTPQDSTPAGTSIEGYWSTAPIGYLLEDGSAVSRTTYAALFSVIGTTFGAGNGSTTFNLPDSRGRTTVAKSTDTEFDTIGEKTGSKTETLSIAQMPSHTHTQNAHNHSQNPHTHVIPRHDTGNDQTIGANRGYVTSGGHHPTIVTNPTTATNIATTATNQNTGGGGSHNNIQPSIVVTRAIKY